MSIFGNILGKIFHHGSAKAAAPSSTPAAPTQAPQALAVAAPVPTAPAAELATSSQAPAVDVGVVLETMASMKDDHGGNYRNSIVDLLKLLDLDSGLSARKELAGELGVNAGDHGSAEQNIALHRAVMDKLAANGGLVPDSLRS